MPPRVLAVGIDAAPGALIHGSMAMGRMPSLARLAARGNWVELESAGRIGSGAVWPTFYTGTPPEAHGRYAEWIWRPDLMAVERITPAATPPFWKSLDSQGVKVGILDVPFAPVIGLERGFEIHEWGAHDVGRGELRYSPTSLRGLLEGLPPHPYSPPLLVSRAPSDGDTLKRVAAESLTGIRLRGELATRLIEDSDPDLALIVFPELHHAGHDLWHTHEPTHPLFADQNYADGVSPSLLDLYEAVDAEIGRFLDLVGSACTVVVFSLHGMRAGPGVPTILQPFMRQLGYARPMGLVSKDLASLRRAFLHRAKRSAPSWLRSIYKRSVPQMTRVRSAANTILEPLHWEGTSAFPLPVEWHGYIRLNLHGRESAGIVAPHQRGDLIEELKAAVTDRLVTREGERLVRDVIVPGHEADPMELKVPDLIVHWEQNAHAEPLDLAEPGFVAPKTAQGRTGEHNMDTFCLVAGGRGAPSPERLATHELGAWLSELTLREP